MKKILGATILTVIIRSSVKADLRLIIGVSETKRGAKNAEVR